MRLIFAVVCLLLMCVSMLTMFAAVFSLFSGGFIFAGGLIGMIVFGSLFAWLADI